MEILFPFLEGFRKLRLWGSCKCKSVRSAWLEFELLTSKLKGVFQE